MPGPWIAGLEKYAAAAAGGLFLLTDADRPASWIVAGGSATSDTQVAFTAYTPKNVTALLLKCTHRSHVAAYAFYLKKNGTTETDNDKLVTIDHYAEGASAAYNGTNLQVLVDCDENGTIQYKWLGAYTGRELYLTILGFYWAGG